MKKKAKSIKIKFGESKKLYSVVDKIAKEMDGKTEQEKDKIRDRFFNSIPMNF